MQKTQRDREDHEITEDVVQVRTKVVKGRLEKPCRMGKAEVEEVISNADAQERVGVALSSCSLLGPFPFKQGKVLFRHNTFPA